MRNELKSDYKTASESAKIEYHGNKRFLGISVATGAANLTATILGILTPVVVSATVTTGSPPPPPRWPRCCMSAIS